MNTFTAESIRNIVILGHGGAGKTSLAEAVLHKAGVTERFGKISEGTTACDYDPEEIKRKISVNLSLAPCEWHTVKIANSKINLIDTPGYFDFAGEVNGALHAVESALIVINAKNGVQVGTEKAWKYADEHSLAKMMFINFMDDENADFDKVVDQIHDKFGAAAAVFRIPIKEGKEIKGYVNVVSGKAYTVSNDVETEIPIPEHMKQSYDKYHDALVEAVALSSDELLERYFAGDTITDDEMRSVLKGSVKKGLVVPVYGGFSTGKTFAVRSLMDAMLKYLPSPAEVYEENTDSSALNAIVFKTLADSYGKISMIRVKSGVLKADSTVTNVTRDSSERIGKLYIMRGKKQIETPELHAGDIGVATKLSCTLTGDTLQSGAKNDNTETIEFPPTVISMAIKAEAKGDEEKISSGLAKLMEEDPTVTLTNNKETKELIISGLGELHLDVISSKLKAKFGVSVKLEAPKVAYRETIRKSVKVQGRHKKQSGGHGQFGDVWIEFSHHDGEDMIFEENIFGGAVPKNYFPAVEKGLRECCAKGVLAGYPVVGLKAVLVDGSYHPVDSSEMAFKVAASIAYKEGLKMASPVLLEPIGHLEVLMPEDLMGDIIGDINKRRGRIIGMSTVEDSVGQVIAEVPMGEMFKYATDLRSMTQARGSFTFKFERYEEAPENVAQKVIEKSKADAE
ncbi:MAG: elongation factor G [Clostridia bacterium]|nr:elongation factor G [Clostridia bacterium]